MDQTVIENGFYLLKYTNERATLQKHEKEVSEEFIQFHFCLRETAHLSSMVGVINCP